MTVSPPRVFVSYSHDSAAHKQWVLEFATTLRNRGVDAILDQWDLKPGDDLPAFMEQNLVASDFAIMICTQRYVEKANAGKGGVGYEKMIMTSSSLKRISGNKVIPIIRERGTLNTPTFLTTKLYIDFSNDNEIEFSLDELLRVLLNAPLYKKPDIGADPFKPLEDTRPNRTADAIRDIMVAVASCFDDTKDEYILRSTLIDASGMRRLTFDKYFQAAIEQELLFLDRGYCVHLMDDGIAYLNREGIVDA